MFTRVVELRAKSWKAKELAKTIYDKALPILRGQTGFVDEVVLVSDTEPDHLLAPELLEQAAGCPARPAGRT